MNLYVGSDGRRYTDREIWKRLEQESWRVFCWNVETGLQVFETEDQSLLFLRSAGEGQPPLPEGRTQEHL